MTTQLPTLPGMVDGIVGRDLLGWTIQCRGCGRTSTARRVHDAMRELGAHFHKWPDDTNPRLCRDCRLTRGCDCHRCKCERQGTEYPT